jgi:hypothetical protein
MVTRCGGDYATIAIDLHRSRTPVPIFSPSKCACTVGNCCRGGDLFLKHAKTRLERHRITAMKTWTVTLR